MSVTFDTAGQAQLVASVKGDAWLVDLDFSTGPIHVTNWPVNVDSGGFTYLGAGHRATVGSLDESEDTNPNKLVLGLTIVDTAMLALSIGPSSVYRNRGVKIWMQLFDEFYQPKGAPRLRWQGTMNKMRHKRSPSPAQGGNNHGRIEMECARAGADNARRVSGLRMSHEQHVRMFPGDTGTRYVSQLVSEPSLWLTKRFQEQELG